MNAKSLNKLRVLDRHHVHHILSDCLGEVTDILAYSAAYIISKCNGKIPDSFDSFLSEYNIKAQLSPVLFNVTSDKWEQLSSLAASCNTDEFTSFLLYENISSHRSRQQATPAGVCKLASRLLQIKKNHRTADLCTGTGNFIRESYADGVQGEFFGNDTDPNNRAVAMMRADILGNNIIISAEDTFRLSQRFDRIFCNVPLGKKYRDFEHTNNINASADWLFAQKCASLLEKCGKAVCLMTNGCTWNLNDKIMRKEVVESGYIEAVIALPNNMFDYSSIGTSLIVLSKGNKDIAFVDATEMFTPGRRINLLTDKDLSAILDSLKVCKRIPIDKVKEENYDLYPRTYTNKPQIEKNSVPFEEIIKRITRGTQIKSAELDQLICTEETDIRLLMLSNMNKGVISEELPFISKLDKRYNKYCAKNLDMILTKNGYPVKTAIVSIKGDTKMLVNGNLYIIELDTSKVVPYYLKAYLESHHGQEQLKSICVGVKIPNIPIESLKKLMIPLRSMDEQRRIASDYIMKQKKVLRLRQELTEAENELSAFF